MDFSEAKEYKGFIFLIKMEYELRRERHPSVERYQWLETTVIEYFARDKGDDSFKMYGGGGLTNLCFLVSEPFCFVFNDTKNDKKRDIPIGNYTVRIDWEGEIDRINCKCYETEDEGIIEEICRRVYVSIDDEEAKNLEIEKMRSYFRLED